MDKIIKYFEKTVVLALMAILGIIILITTYELVVMLIQELIQGNEENKLMPLNIKDLFGAFSLILFVVIGLELFETLKIFLQKQEIPAEVILLVALTAIARKIIILDYDKYTGVVYLGIAAIVVSLSFGYFLIKKASKKKKKKKKKKDLD